MLPRRDFFKLTGLAALANGLPDFCMPFKAPPAAETRQARLLPKRLQAGNTIALIAPSSPVAEEKLSKAIANLSALGLTIVEGKNLRNRAGYLAGSDAERLADLHAAFENPDIDAVWCVRGGYGAARLLPSVNFSLIKKHPKLLIGYSDITALHLAIQAQTGLVTFHGPVGAGDFTEMTLHHLKSVVMNAPDRHEISAVPDTTLGEEYQPYTITPGIVRGALTGGNLALLSSMAGTPFAPKFKNKVVFIEDVGEQPYRLDRMFTQLLQASDLHQAAGIALGVFNECQPKKRQLFLLAARVIAPLPRTFEHTRSIRYSVRAHFQPGYPALRHTSRVECHNTSTDLAGSCGSIKPARQQNQAAVRFYACYRAGKYVGIIQEPYLSISENA